MKEIYAQAVERQNIAKEKMKQTYDKKINYYVYEENDRVWLNNLARVVGLSPKLGMKYNGPFRITKKLSDLNYEVAAEDNLDKKQVVHVNRLKPCNNRPLDEQRQLLEGKSDGAATKDKAVVAEKRNEHDEHRPPKRESSVKASIPGNTPMSAQQKKHVRFIDQPSVLIEPTRRSERVRTPKTMYSAAVNVKHEGSRINTSSQGHGPAIATVKYLLIWTCIVALTPAAFSIETPPDGRYECGSDNLALYAGNILVCGLGHATTTISLSEPKNCTEMSEYSKNKRQELIKAVYITPHFKKVTSTPFKIYTCSEVTTIITTYTSFLGSHNLMNRAIVYKSVPELQCREYVKQVESKSEEFKLIVNDVWSNNVDEKLARYRWCCSEEQSTYTEIILQKGSAAVDYKSLSLITSLFPSIHCSLKTTFCIQDTLTAVWAELKVEACDIQIGERVTGQLHGEYIVSHEGQLAARLTGRTETHCGVILNTTHEGIFITIEFREDDESEESLMIRQLYEAIPVKNDNNEQGHTDHNDIKQDEVRSHTTNLLATMSYIFAYNRQLAVNLFLRSWLDICLLQTSRYHLYTNLQTNSPTAIARAILRRNDVVAYSYGFNIMNVVACIEVKEYRFRQTREAGFCFAKMPITYVYNNYSRGAYLDLATKMITEVGGQQACGKQLITALPMKDKKSMLIYDGFSCKTGQLNIQYIDFLSPIPAIQNVYLDAGKMFDEKFEALESVIRLSEMQNSIQSLTRIIAAQIKGKSDGASSVALIHAAAEIGVETGNLFKSISNEIDDFFTPSFTTILIIVSILAVLLVTLVTCYCPKLVQRQDDSEPVRNHILAQLRETVSRMTNASTTNTAPLPPPPPPYDMLEMRPMLAVA
jgi:hypothetical protein